MITEEEVSRIRNQLINSGVDYKPLQDELVDHITNDIEKIMLTGKSFAVAYNEVKAYLDYENVDFNEVQNDTKTLLDYKSRFLKILTISVFSITLIGFGFKFLRISGGSSIQLLSFFLLAILYFRFAYHFFKDKRDKKKKAIASVFGSIGMILPLTYIVYIFFPQYHTVAIRLNIVSYLLLSTSVWSYLKTYRELNIFRIEQKTRRIDLFLANTNVLLAISTLLLNLGGFQLVLNYFLFGVIGINIAFGLFLITTYQVTNRLTSMLIVSVLTIHIYHIPNLFH